MKKIHVINEAEGIFLPCFDKTLNNLAEFSTNNCMKKQNWDSMKIDSKEKSFSITWTGQVKTGDYDTLLLFAMVPDYMKISASVFVGGKEISVFENIHGTSTGPIEPCGKVPTNSEIEKMVLSFQVENADINLFGIKLYWVGFRSSEREYLLEQKEVYDINSWNGYINFDVKPSSRNNVMFTDEEIQTIKEKIKLPEYKNIAEEIYQKAKDAENFEPEKMIGKYYPVGDARYTRVRDRGRDPLEKNLFALSVAGYLFDNNEWSNLAARIIMSMAQIPYWFEGSQCNMEGSTWHHVCFTEQRVIQSIMISIGFLDGKFTPKAIENIKKAILPHYKTVVKCCKEKGYRKFCNQGMVEASGRMLGACGLYYLGMEDFVSEVEECYNEHTQMMNDYISEEGHCVEGPAYFQFTLEMSITLWKTYSKFKNVPISEVVPERVGRTIKYLDCISSVAYPIGAAVPFSDAHGKRYGDLELAFFTSVFNWKKGMSFVEYRKINEKVKAVTDILADIFIMCYEIDTAKAENSDETKYYIFEKSGLASIEKENSKFWFLAERNPRTGHFHKDRGSIMLEYDGEEILADLGVSNYANWRGDYMKKQQYHNLSCPENIEMRLQSDIAEVSTDEAGIGCRTVVSVDDFLYPEAKVNYIKQMEDGISFSANLEEVYPGVEFGKREGHFKFLDNGASLMLCDEWKIPEAMPVLVNFVSFGKWDIGENCASVCVNNVKLTLEFESDEKFELIEDDFMFDLTSRQMYTLRLRTEKGNSHKIVTKGVIEKV